MGSDDRNTDKGKVWTEAVRRGNKQAFEELFKEYYFLLTRFAWRSVKSKAIAEELVQDVFAQIWEERTTWAPSGSVKAWLYKAVKHRSLDHLKHQKVRQQYDPQWMDQYSNPIIEFEDDYREKQIREALQRAIEELPPRSRMTYKLHRLDGLTYQEIAQVMDISVKTVESQMTRTLKMLRNRLSNLLALLLTIVLGN